MWLMLTPTENTKKPKVVIATNEANRGESSMHEFSLILNQKHTI